MTNVNYWNPLISDLYELSHMSHENCCLLRSRCVMYTCIYRHNSIIIKKIVKIQQFV